MPVGEWRAHLRLQWARWLGDKEKIDDAGQQLDEYQTGFLRKAEQRYGMRLSQLDSFYLYNAPPQIPADMPEEQAFGAVAPRMCDPLMGMLQRCHQRASWADSVALRFYHMRLHTCHFTFHRFMKCIVRRDAVVMRNVEAFDRARMRHMAKKERDDYVDRIVQKSEYYDYMRQVTPVDSRLANYYEKRQKELRRRKLRALAFADELAGLPPDPRRDKIKANADATNAKYDIGTQ